MGIKTLISKHFKNQLLTYVDVGAADNTDTRWWKISKSLEFIGFEPNSDQYKKITNKGFGKYIIHNFALGEKSGSMRLNITKNEFVSSFLFPNFKGVNEYPNSDRFKIKKKISIKIKKLDDLKLKNADFIKIDTQGYNLRVLKGSNSTLNKVLGFDIETEFFQMYKNQHLFEDTKKYLEKKNFIFVNFHNLRRWQLNKKFNYGKVIWCNSLFLRKLKKKDYQNNALVLKYIIICVLYNNLDIAHKTLIKSKLPKFQKNEIDKLLLSENRKNYFVKIYVSIFNRLSRFLKKEVELFPTF
tara:strand:+ start:640 stop:1533 length:894 start_codon:yes stop_codon:yes gene_type:complete